MGESVTLMRQLKHALCWFALVCCSLGYAEVAAPSGSPAGTNAKVWRVALATNGAPGATIVCDTANGEGQSEVDIHCAGIGCGAIASAQVAGDQSADEHQIIPIGIE